MERSLEWEQKILVSELAQGKELAKQLGNHLNPSSSSLEARQSLVEKILSSYEKALSMLNCGAFAADQPKPTTGITKSPHSFINSSSRSEVSDQDCKEELSNDVSRKRKTQPRWTEQVKVCSGNGLEGPLDDGYGWRKYGQKVILGAKFPRGYYRCTHRHSQGCLATKQVQRSDENHSIFEVNYQGRHTCSQASPPPVASPSLNNDFSKRSKYLCQQQREEKPQPSKEIFLHVGLDCNRVRNDSGSMDDIFPSFSFPCTSSGNEIEENNIFTSFSFPCTSSGNEIEENNIFPSFSFPCTSSGNEIEENNIFTESMVENFPGSCSPTFKSPATSESNYFSVSPCHMNSFGTFYQSVKTRGCGLTNSPTRDLDISIDDVDFDTTFPFDNLEFLA